MDLAPGTSVAVARRALAAALGPASGLEVLSASARAARIEASAAEGLHQLKDIAALLVAAAILALAAALTFSIGSAAPIWRACVYWVCARRVCA